MPQRRVQLAAAHEAADTAGSTAEPRSNPNEIWNYHQYDADPNEQPVAAHEVRINHQRESADQRDHTSLLLPVYEETEPDGSEQQTPKERRRVHLGFTSNPLIGSNDFSPGHAMR